MLKKIIEFCKSHKIIINRLLFTFFFIFLFQIGTLITIPGVKWTSDTQNKEPDQFIKLLSLIGGGVLNKLSIFAIGISPFITASIIVQLLSSGLIPRLNQWKKQGKKGQIKLNYIIKFFMLPIGYAQSLGILTSLNRIGMIKIQEINGSNYIFLFFVCPLILITGTMITMFVGDLITQKGIGSGISVIIFVGILSSFSQQILNEIRNIYDLKGIFVFLIYLFSMLLLLIFIIFLNNSQRKIPIQQTGSGLRLKNQHKSFLPIKLNPSGVIPVIFASTFISFFGSIKEILKSKKIQDNVISTHSENYIKFVEKYLNFQEGWYGIIIFSILVLFFGLLYSNIAVNSEKIAEDFRKNGIYIIGIHIGKSTEKYISYVLVRIAFFGSLYLSFLAIFVLIMKKVLGITYLSLSGTSLLILVVIGENIIGQLKDIIIQSKYLNFEKQRKDSFLW